MLEITRRGLADLQGQEPDVRPMGLYNIAVFGRSVTLVLQNMRTLDERGFDAWYAPYVAEMHDDALCNYFKRLRNEILKEGPPSISSNIFIERLDGSDIARLTADPPPGARGFFIGDPLGGSGWDVELPDGQRIKYYVQLPSDLRVQISLMLPNPPDQHLGKPIADKSLEGLSRLYFEYLDRLVRDAEVHFLPSTSR